MNYRSRQKQVILCSEKPESSAMHGEAHQKIAKDGDGIVGGSKERAQDNPD